jgi:hypothetical protein
MPTQIGKNTHKKNNTGNANMITTRLTQPIASLSISRFAFSTAISAQTSPKDSKKAICTNAQSIMDFLLHSQLVILPKTKKATHKKALASEQFTNSTKLLAFPNSARGADATAIKLKHSRDCFLITNKYYAVKQFQYNLW